MLKTAHPHHPLQLSRIFLGPSSWKEKGRRAVPARQGGQADLALGNMLLPPFSEIQTVRIWAVPGQQALILFVTSPSFLSHTSSLYRTQFN